MMPVRLEAALAMPRQIGISVTLDGPVDTLTNDQIRAARTCILRHGVVSFVTPTDILDESSIFAFMSVLGKPFEVPVHYRTLSLTAYINVVANVDSDGNPSPQSYRHSGFWHADGQYFPLRPSAFCNIMVPQITNATRTLFLDTLLTTQEERERFASLRDTKISLMRIMEGKVIAAITKNVWQKHPITGEINLLVPSDRGRDEQDLIDCKDPKFRKAEDVRRAMREDPRRCYAHSYTIGEILVWDNRQVLHRAEGEESDVKGPRYIYRGHFEFFGSDLEEGAA